MTPRAGHLQALTGEIGGGAFDISFWKANGVGELNLPFHSNNMK
jgi:hypothetical protein